MGGFFYNLGRSFRPSVQKLNLALCTLTGDEEGALASEYELGREMATEIGRAMVKSEDQWLRQSTDSVTDLLASSIKDSAYRFHVEILIDDAPTAFVVPGGFIFVSTGLLELCHHDRDEVASVIGHEMGHVLHKHAIEKLALETIDRLRFGTAFSGGGAAGKLRKIGLGIIRQSFSQECELEADAFSVRLCRAAGFDPEGSQRLIRRLGALRSEGQSTLLDQYLSTHPPLELRLRNIQQVLSSDSFGEAGFQQIE